MDVVFEDGGTATGSSEYDDVLDTFYNLSITTTTGTELVGTTYETSGILATALAELRVFDRPAGSPLALAGAHFLRLDFVARFVYGTPSVEVGGLFTLEGVCSNSTACSGVPVESRSPVSGAVFADPRTIVLLSLALLGVFRLRHSQRS